MQRQNFTLDDATIALLERLSDKYYQGNKSLTVRAALESLSAHVRHEGWVVSGYVPVVIEGEEHCHTCGDTRAPGDVLYRPVFERGEGSKALPRIPTENWLDCPTCVEQLEC